MTGKSITARELAERLEADPEFVARRAQKENELQEKMWELRKSEFPLVEELRENGFDISSAWDFLDFGTQYRSAIPILLKHLCRPYPTRVREGIARSLARPWARDVAWDYVLHAYLTEPEAGQGGVKDALAVALSQMAGPKDADKISELISDETNGQTRVFFVRPLARKRSGKARETLLRLQNDPDLNKEISAVLRRKACD